MNRHIIRHGFSLILLSLLSGMFVSALAIPRLALSAHTIGLLSGVLLIAIGAIWKQFTLSRRLQSVLYWSWVYSSYANWFGCLVGAALGAGKMTPVASAGVVGSSVSEGIVKVLLTSVVVASFIAVGVSLWGLRRAVPATQD